MSKQQRRIAHVDMDAFFASVELLRYPQLRGLPVVIGGKAKINGGTVAAANIALEAFPRLADYVGRGVITTATYAARQFGIGSAMGLMKAARLCPHAILLPVDFAEYAHYSQWFKRIIVGIAPSMQEAGIDEVYVDISHAADGQCDGGYMLARRLQQQIAQETGLSCSIGVAPNKLLAKMASELNKPNGITILQPIDVQERIWPLACCKINGIGPKTHAKLQLHGIHTIGALAKQPRAWLMAHFGRAYGAWLHDAAWGRDDSPVVTEKTLQSMSRETTFTRNLHAVHDRSELGRIFTVLCQQVASDLQQAGYAGRTIGIKLRYADFTSVTRAQTVNGYTQNAASIRHVAGLCLKRVALTQPLRLLGVRVASLVISPKAKAAVPAGENLSLF